MSKLFIYFTYINKLLFENILFGVMLKKTIDRIEVCVISSTIDYISYKIYETLIKKHFAFAFFQAKAF